MRVCIVPEYPMNLMTGGLQVQAEETCKALQKLGDEVTATLFNWSDVKQPADIYHFIGFPPYLYRLMELVKSAGRPYVITMLFGGVRSSFNLRLASMRRWMKSEILRLRSRQDAILNASALITITKSEARALQIVHGIKPDKIYIVPNGVDESFFNATPHAWHNVYGDAPFILSVGAIQPRKNQLLLLQAANRVRLPVVLLGPVLPEWEEYGFKVKKEAEINATYGGKWLQDLRNDNPLLVSAYAACRLFVLLSSSETQPLSVLQAMAAKKPVLLLKAPYTEEEPFNDIPTTTAQNIEVVASTLLKHWNNGIPASLPALYSWREVALKLKSIYEKILHK